MLLELLARVREILDVDTAAVLILDEQSGELVARAACGIEDEVRQGVRVPLGTGFAGRIAATKDAVRLDRVDSTTVANPILWEKGIKVMLGVPLLQRRQGPRRAARRAAREPTVRSETTSSCSRSSPIALRARSRPGNSRSNGRRRCCSNAVCYRRRCRVVRDSASRRATSPPKDARSAAIGIDLFTLPSGQLWIVVGDVAGHGLQAAVVMGRIRSALRAYTLLDASPERVLDLVDRKVNHFEIGTHRDGGVRRHRPALRHDDPRSGRASTTGHRGAWATGLVRGGRRPVRRSERTSRVNAFVDDDHARARCRRRVLHRRPHRAPR